jgi:hypothetical protein
MEEWVFFFHYSNKIRNRERNGWWVLFAAIYNNNDLQKSRESFAALFFCRRGSFLWLFKEKRLLFWERKTESFTCCFCAVKKRSAAGFAASIGCCNYTENKEGKGRDFLQ